MKLKSERKSGRQYAVIRLHILLTINCYIIQAKAITDLQAKTIIKLKAGQQVYTKITALQIRFFRIAKTDRLVFLCTLRAAAIWSDSCLLILVFIPAANT